MQCTLRPWRLEDLAALSVALNNKNVQDFLRDGLPLPYTVRDAEDYISAMLAVGGNITFAYAIVVQEQVVGSIGVFRKENIHFRTAEIGYYLAETHWGMGIGTSALMQACDTIFATTDILRIFAEPFAENAASCRILEKAGFVVEGIMRQNAVKNGNVLDMKLYAKIKTI